MKLNHIISLLICLSILALPVSAGYSVTGQFTDISQVISQTNVNSFTYTADPDEKIVDTVFYVPLNTLVNFTLYYGTGSTVSGSIEYVPYLIVGKSTSTLMLGSDTKTVNFIDAQVSGYSALSQVRISGYARNESGSAITDVGFAVYDKGYGIYSDMLVYYPVSNLPSNLIYRIDIVSTQGITVVVETGKTDVFGSHVSATLPENLVGKVTGQITSLWGYVGLIWGVFYSLFYWLKFIFIDNLVLTTCLYISGTMGYCAMTSRNVFEFYKKFFRLQRSIFEFAAGAFNVLVQMITAVINALKPL